MSEQTQQPPAPTQSDPKSEAPEHHYHHEAEKTELEKWINAGYSKVQPYSNQLLIGVIGVAVIVLVVLFWTKSNGSARTAEWQEFVENRVPDDYMTLAEDNPDSSVATWALLKAGRGFLQEGMQTALSNRETSDNRLEEAVDAFEKLLKKSDADDIAREEALLGLGTAREVLEGGNPEPAVEAYQTLLKEFPESRHAAWAQKRIDELQSQEAQEFYAWFRKQNPKPSDRPLPGDLTGQPPEPELGNLDLLSDPKMQLPPTGVGEENTNTVPTDEELDKKTEESGDSKTAKPFPGTSPEPEADKKESETEAAPAVPAESEAAAPAKEEPAAAEEKSE